MSDFLPKPRYITHDGLKLALYEAGPKDGPPIVLLHGWPETSLSWKDQLPALAAAGYRAVAYDLRGFGNSGAPEGPEHYSMVQIVSDVEAVIDDLGGRAIIMGHDWGGIIVWSAARMLGRKVSHVISLCTPHMARPPIDPVTIFKARFGDEFYMVHFNERYGEAEKLFAQNPDAFFRMMFRTVPDGLEADMGSVEIPKLFQQYLDAGTPDIPGHILSDDERAAFVKSYQRSGFHGGINYYRNFKTNWDMSEGLSNRVVQPSLMISARQDIVLPPEMTDPMVDMVPDLERHIVENCGHWMTWEQPDEVNRLVLDWLGRRA